MTAITPTVQRLIQSRGGDLPRFERFAATRSGVHAATVGRLTRLPAAVVKLEKALLRRVTGLESETLARLVLDGISPTAFTSHISSLPQNGYGNRKIFLMTHHLTPALRDAGDPRRLWVKARLTPPRFDLDVRGEFAHRIKAPLTYDLEPCVYLASLCGPLEAIAQGTKTDVMLSYLASEDPSLNLPAFPLAVRVSEEMEDDWRHPFIRGRQARYWCAGYTGLTAEFWGPLIHKGVPGVAMTPVCGRFVIWSSAVRCAVGRRMRELGLPLDGYSPNLLRSNWGSVAIDPIDYNGFEPELCFAALERARRVKSTLR